MSRMGSLLPAARRPPSMRLLFFRASAIPDRALFSIHSSIILRGKTHFPVTRVQGIRLALMSAYTCFSWMDRCLATSLVFMSSSGMIPPFWRPRYFNDLFYFLNELYYKLLLFVTNNFIYWSNKWRLKMGYNLIRFFKKGGTQPKIQDP